MYWICSDVSNRGFEKPNAQIRSAALHIKNKKTLKMGAGKTFDISVHKVKDKWSAKKLTFNNRPAYEAEAAAKTGHPEKRKLFTGCDSTRERMASGGE